MNLVTFIEQLLEQQNKTWAELTEYLVGSSYEQIINHTKTRLLCGMYSDTTLNKLATFFNLDLSNFKES